MRIFVASLVLALVVSACTAEGDSAAPAAETDTTVPSTVTESASDTSGVSEAPASSDVPTDGTTVVPDEGIEPQYDVFLAALAEALEGTRFEDTVLEEPEVVASSGLLLCERLDAGLTQDEVVVEYLAELTEGDVAQADDDQLTLAGALVGAAVEALCPTE